MFSYELPENKILTFDLNYDYESNPKNNTIEIIYEIINLVHKYDDYEEVYKGFQLVVKRTFNSENLPKFWTGYIHSKNYLEMHTLYNGTNMFNNWNYSSQFVIEKSFNSNMDTIIENRFSLRNMHGTYKSPEYILSEMKKYIDEMEVKREINSLEFNLNHKLEIN